MIVCATGHRPHKLGGYDRITYSKLVSTADVYLLGVKPSKIIVGGALGWDQAFAHAGLNHGIPVVTAVPFAGQESKWPKQSQDHYNWLLNQCADVVIVSEGGYSPYKMQVRNEWMVDNSDRTCALWDGTSGGTGNCVSYADRVGKSIDNMWEFYKSL